MPRRSPTSAKTNSPTVQSSAWRINLFGGLSAWRGNVETARFQSRKSGGLLAYLAYHLNQTHSRDILIDRIWPDLDADRARVCLSTAAYSLRRQLEPPNMPSNWHCAPPRVRRIVRRFITKQSGSCGSSVRIATPSANLRISNYCSQNGVSGNHHAE